MRGQKVYLLMIDHDMTMHSNPFPEMIYQHKQDAEDAIKELKERWNGWNGTVEIKEMIIQ